MIRRIAAIVLVVLGLLFGAIGNVSGWVWWQFGSTNHFVDTVGPLSKNPKVADALSSTIVDQAFTKYDVQQRIEGALPSKAKPLAVFLLPQAKTIAADAGAKVIESDQFHGIWVRALRTGHAQALGILRNDSRILKATDRVASLDLQGTVDKLDKELQKHGITVLENRKVGTRVGKIEVFKKNQLKTAQTAFRLFDAVKFWFPILALLCFAGAIGVAHDRRKTLLYIGVSITGVMLVEGVGLRLTRNGLLDSVRPENRDAALVVWNQLLHQLKLQMWALVVFGVVIWLAAAYLGPGRREVAFRNAVQGRIGSWREGGMSEATQDRLGAALAPWKRVIQVALVVLVLIALVALPSVRPRAVILATILLVLLLGLVEFVAGPSRDRDGA
jgi:hypothetical protein